VSWEVSRARRMQKEAKYLIGLAIFLLGSVIPPPSLGKVTPQVEDFEEYVWWVPPRNNNPPSDLATQLEEEVTAIVQAGHLAPYYFERGITSREGVGGGGFWRGNVLWFNPADVIYTLSYAMPYLSSDLQVEVEAYLKQELENYPPFQRLRHPGYLWILDGTRREPYDLFPIDDASDLNVWPVPPEPVESPQAMIENLYALWAYAHATGDWQYISNHWAEITDVYNANKDILSYGAIGGVMGYARLADHLGLYDIAQEAAQEAVNRMQAGLDFDQFLEAANRAYPDPTDHHSGWRAPVFFYLTPEVGRFLAENIALPVQQYLDDFTAENANSVWYITKAGAQRDWGEQSYHGPERAWAIFMAKAYVMREHGESLRDYLDIPLCLGDLYYIQKLVAIIDAYTGLPDPTPPNISDVAVPNVTFHSATITWRTDEPATTQVEYGLDTSYGSITRLIPALVTNHRVTLVGLKPSSTYHFKARSSNSGGNSESDNYTLSTTDAFQIFLPSVAKVQ